VHANRKLTGVIRGRRPVSITGEGDAAVVTFDDGSRMMVQLSGPPPALPQDAGPVRKVRQSGLDLALDLETGGTLGFRLAEETSSVLLRAKDQTFEYAD
jgi:hypothetical protein